MDLLQDIEAHEGIPVQIKLTGGQMPTRATIGSAGLDLYAYLPQSFNYGKGTHIGPGDRQLISCGFSMALPSGWEAQVRPRSGLALKRGLTVLNSPGTIDSDYRGDIGIVLHNTSSHMQMIENGDRIAQMVIAPVSRTIWEQAETLADTERGSGGFGSTGIKKQSSGKKEAPLS